MFVEQWRVESKEGCSLEGDDSPYESDYYFCLQFHGLYSILLFEMLQTQKK